MQLRNAFGLLIDLTQAIKVAFIPTIRDLTRTPSLIIHPASISRVFMSHVWTFFGNAINENCYEIKKALLSENARGVVLDLGAGHGHTASYLDVSKVTKYVALEPNARMHGEICKAAHEAGFSEDAGTFLLLPYGAEDVSLINSALGGLHGVDTLVSVLTLCSVPALEETIPALINQVLKPGGQLLYFEHVLNKREDVAWWQKVWTRIWQYAFDGCRLDCPTDTIIDRMDVWEKKDIHGLEEEGPEHLFIHSIGKLTKRSDAILL